MNKVYILIFIAILLLPTQVHALDFYVDVDRPDSFFAGEIDYINVTITNNGITGVFSFLQSLPVSWIEPQLDIGSFQIEADKNRTVQLKVEPPKYIDAGTYKYTFAIQRVATGSSLTKEILLYVEQTAPVVIKNFTLSCTNCIGDTLIVSGILENIGRESKTVNVNLRRDSDLKTIAIGMINVSETKHFEGIFSLSALSPAFYQIEAKVVDDIGNLIYSDTKDFEIPVIENIDYDKDFIVTPFGTFATLTAVNNGNSDADAEFRSEVSRTWYSVFLGPQPSDMVEGEFIWTLNVPEGERQTITYSEIYWPTPLITIIAIILAILFYSKYTALLITKDVASKHPVSKGKEIGVSIHVKNRGREVENVVARDLIPKKFSVTGHFHTIKPLIKRTDKGTELVWDVGRMKPNEERMLHYKIKPIEDVHGTLRLPPVYVRARKGERLILQHSTPTTLLGKEKKVESVKVHLEE